MKEIFCRSRFLLVLLILFLLVSCGTPDEKKMVFFSKGQTLLEAGDFVKARLEFKNAIQIDTEFAKGSGR